MQRYFLKYSKATLNHVNNKSLCNRLSSQEFTKQMFVQKFHFSGLPASSLKKKMQLSYLYLNVFKHPEKVEKIIESLWVQRDL